MRNHQQMYIVTFFLVSTTYQLTNDIQFEMVSLKLTRLTLRD